MFPCFRKRRARRSQISSPVVVLDLDEPETARKESEKEKSETKASVSDEKKTEANKSPEQSSGVSACSSSALPNMDRLKEELSCAICSEICFEPSSTLCGHSFCMKCLRSAVDKCGRKCPKCRQLISNGRSCTVNTVLWNTIQLLFPQEVEARKAAGALNGREAARSQIPEAAFYNNLRRNRSTGDTSVRRRVNVWSHAADEEHAAFLPRLLESAFYDNNMGTPSAGDTTSVRRRRMIELSHAEIPETASHNNNNNMWNIRGARGPVISTTDHTSLSRRGENVDEEDAAIAQRPQRTTSTGVSRRDAMLRAMLRVSGQNEDAAIAQRLQREEFMEAFRGTNGQSSSSSLSLARVNLRAMASSVVNRRIRDQYYM
ncbi:hypothetical protein FH972_007285 [Carpinus fangiana]|uniref:RING-type E3 ubiquitin transferase n=1 Tax=Carpinus fangiana TaxID=176857 RepID=A0A5N6QY60_9ROSI|nr:hypothetical protein FH972_007285 [Carpinus fangiana]